MSGETEQNISGWTVDTLHATLQRQIDDMRRHLDERYATQTKAVEAALTAQQMAMRTAFEAADKALDKALAAAEKAVDARAATLDREFHEHLEQVRHENSLAFVNSDKAVQAALASAKEAVSKAERDTEKRFESVNEFRAQLNDQAKTFLPRSEYDTAHDALVERVGELRDRVNRAEGKSLGSAATIAGLLAVATVVIAVVVVIVNVLTN